TGKMPLPPKWALGFHQSRYSYETEQEVRTLAEIFRERGIPLDAVHLDIHYMNGYRVFTFDQERFPNPQDMVNDLREQGIHIVPIVDAGVKVDENDSTYKEGLEKDLFCKYPDGQLFFGDVWPGNSAFPDFTKTDAREWWGNLNRFYSDLGIDGIWNDMNEPAVFNETKTMDVEAIHDNDGNPKTHRELHNVYGMLMEESTYEGMKKLLNGKRPFVLTRAGFAGIQRYAAVWTGDNRSFWEHLAMTLPMCMNLGVSGVALCGSDVGGFAHDASGELLARWTQVGAFLPYFRNHSAIETRRQEPWAFGEKYEAIIKKYIELRYKWLPHLYPLFKQTHETGIPVMRPLFMEYPGDPCTYNLSDQFMIGSDVLIAPILTPDTQQRAVYLPDGEWYDYWTDQKYAGGRHYLIKADLETLPIFIKAGAFLFEGEVRSSTSVPLESLTIHLYPRIGSFSTVFYDDDGESFAYVDGEGYSERYRCHFDGKKLKLETEIKNDRYLPSWSDKRLMMHNLPKDTEILVNGSQVLSVKDESCGVKIIELN
ncbi:MAG TPA: TIM-barrel domain-containing protein, partial [Bacillales bacterium]|nr:TIM-barrel domain-containing protein [Bacillales bacterium]